MNDSNSSKTWWILFIYSKEYSPQSSQCSLGHTSWDTHCNDSFDFNSEAQPLSLSACPGFSSTIVATGQERWAKLTPLGRNHISKRSKFRYVNPYSEPFSGGYCSNISHQNHRNQLFCFVKDDDLCGSEFGNCIRYDQPDQAAVANSSDVWSLSWSKMRRWRSTLQASPGWRELARDASLKRRLPKSVSDDQEICPVWSCWKRFLILLQTVSWFLISDFEKHGTTSQKRGTQLGRSLGSG